MKKILTLITLFALALPCMAKNAELTGILRKADDTFSPFKLEIDGKTETIFLRGDVLKDMPVDKPVYVTGKIETQMIVQGAMLSRSVDPHWQIFMRVEKWAKIKKPFERPKKSELKSKKQKH